MSKENIRYEQPTVNQIPEILDFTLEYFRVEEPITKAINLTRAEAEPLFREMVMDCVGRPTAVTFIALNGKNEIVGCRLSSIVDLDEKRRKAKSETAEETDKMSVNGQHILNYLEMLEEGCADKVAEYKKSLKFAMVSVRPDHYRMGIAEKLIQKTIALGKEKGCEIVTVTATAFKSQEMFEKKLGFQSINTIMHKDFLDENGKRIFNCKDGLTDCGKFMIKDIKSL